MASRDIHSCPAESKWGHGKRLCVALLGVEEGVRSEGVFKLILIVGQV